MLTASGRVLVLVLLVLALAAAVQARGDLVIAACEPLVPVPGRQPQGLLMTLESPASPEEGPAEFRADGRLLRSAGRGDIQNGRTQVQVYLVQPLRTGPQVVEVRLAGRRTSCRVDFQTEGEGLLLGHFDGETLLAPEDLRVFSWYLRDLVVRLDGREVPLRDGVVKPAWHQGLNLLEIAGVGPAGQPRSRQYRIALVDPARVPLGTELFLAYGQPGGRSGPNYELDCDGSALVREGWAKGPVVHVVQDTWVVPEDRYVARFRAVAPGQAKLVYRVQPHFLLEWEVSREVPIQVEPAAPGWKP